MDCKKSKELERAGHCGVYSNEAEESFIGKSSKKVGVATKKKELFKGKIVKTGTPLYRSKVTAIGTLLLIIYILYRFIKKWGSKKNKLGVIGRNEYQQ